MSLERSRMMDRNRNENGDRCNYIEHDSSGSADVCSMRIRPGAPHPHLPSQETFKIRIEYCTVTVK